MSQSHIPQPNAGGSAPSEVYSSTDSAPHGETIASIGNPGPPKKEVTQHVLAHNNIDSQLYSQNIYCGKFTWSVNDQAGKMLWYIPIHPAAIHPILRVLMMIYNAWGGGFLLNFSIAGTGFHAGKLAIVRIPPNINPADLSGDYDYTIFEYEVMDAKTLEMSTVKAGDQRQVNYHYTTGSPKDPQSWEIGGYIAVFVHLGLNTASTGTPQIQIIVTAKCAPDFQFAQLKMPETKTEGGLVEPISELDRILDFRYIENRFSGITAASQVKRLKVLPSTIKLLYTGWFNTTDADGEFTNKCFKAKLSDKDEYLKYYQRLGIEWVPGVITQADAGKQMEVTVDEYLYKAIYNSVLIFLQGSYQMVAGSNPTELPCHWGKLDVTVASFRRDPEKKKLVIVFNEVIPPGTRIFAGDVVRLLPYRHQMVPGTALPTSLWECPLALPAKESWVVFSDDSSTIVGIQQTHALYAAFASRKYAKSLPPGTAALFVVIDAQEKVPIMTIKLYREGYFSASATASMLEFDITKLVFRFENLVPSTSEIPVNAPINRQLMAAAHRRALRHPFTDPTEECSFSEH